MSDLRELYQEVILDHSRKPRNHRALAGANRHADGYNPLCGDRVTVYLRVEEGVVREVAFEGKGCAISTASCSMMTEALAGKSEEDVRALFDSFHHLVTGKEAATGASPLGKLAVFAGVREFPIRVKCATLAWHTLLAALDRKDEPVSSE
jgi:nitrogen fixation NifU-like protein